jgi:alginate O-acetyltransferase complex protein AlgI
MTQPTTVASHTRWLGLVPAAVIGALLVAAWHATAWVQMWLTAFAIYAGFKWLTYREVLARRPGVPTRGRVLYGLCWPGMSFTESVSDPPSREPGRSVARWLAPAAKAFVGAGLVWFAVPAIATDAWLLRGWVGMVGLIMMLHFGTFHLLALALQAAGFNARPNMQTPLLARSLADFWGNRWNTAFNVLADRYGFRPLTPRIGPRAALAVVFLASGLLHEAVITLPAGAGFGLPTAYFALQAIGVLLERRPLIRRRPIVNRIFAWLVLVAPLGWLFPPGFVRNAVLPMLNAIGAS